MSENQLRSPEKIDILATKNKLQSLQRHLANLTQKKIRLDLEIRKVRQKARKLSSRTQTLVRESTEETLAEMLSKRKEDPGYLFESSLLELEEMRELGHAAKELNQFLENYADLPLFEDA